jgi:hypothetical protein
MKVILFSRICELIKQISEKKETFITCFYTLFFLHIDGFIKNYKKKNRYALTIVSKEME